MFERVHDTPGEDLDRAAYHQDFARALKGFLGTIWKLERAQTFREPHDASWRALDAGDWETALRIFEEERDAVEAEAQANAASGIEIRRLRIAELPITPYLQWEMHSLRLLAEYGFDIRVLDASEIKDAETATRPLPEIVAIGDRVLYHVRYDADQVPCGARRIIDPALIAAATAEISGLHARAEPLAGFFAREVAPLPPPAL